MGYRTIAWLSTCLGRVPACFICVLNSALAHAFLNARRISMWSLSPTRRYPTRSTNFCPRIAPTPTTSYIPAKAMAKGGHVECPLLFLGALSVRFHSLATLVALASHNGALDFRFFFWFFDFACSCVKFWCGYFQATSNTVSRV